MKVRGVTFAELGDTYVAYIPSLHKDIVISKDNVYSDKKKTRSLRSWKAELCDAGAHEGDPLRDSHNRLLRYINPYTAAEHAVKEWIK